MELHKKKPLIAVVTNNDDDVYCFRLELIQALINSGYEVLISCPYGLKFELMKGMKYTYDDTDIDRRGTNPLADYVLYKHYKRLFNEHKPSIILTYTAKPNVYAGIAASQMRIPYISNVTGFGSVLNKTGLMKTFIMRIFKYSYSRSNCIMFQNEANMKLALNLGWIKGNCKLIPGSGVNTERYPLQEYPKGGNGINGAPVVFNYIGRVMHDKGVDDYIEAAKRITAKYPAAEFNIIGFIEPTESHYEGELIKLGEMGIVHYRGNQMDVRPCIARTHATIHPSTYGEGMSNVLLESASSGRPLITTDNPGCRETVQAGITGMIYCGGNVDELIAVIEKFLAMDNEKRCLMGKLGREYVSRFFSRQIVVNTYMEEIARILSGASGEKSEKNTDYVGRLL